MFAPGSKPLQGLHLLFSFYLLPQVLGQSNLNGRLYFIWSKLTMKDNPSFEEEIVLVFESGWFDGHRPCLPPLWPRFNSALGSYVGWVSVDLNLTPRVFLRVLRFSSLIKIDSRPILSGCGAVLRGHTWVVFRGRAPSRQHSSFGPLFSVVRPVARSEPSRRPWPPINFYKWNSLKCSLHHFGLEKKKEIKLIAWIKWQHCRDRLFHH